MSVDITLRIFFYCVLPPSTHPHLTITREDIAATAVVLGRYIHFFFKLVRPGKKEKKYKINRNAHEVRLYIIDSSAIYPLNNNRMIYTRGKSKIDGPADTKYRTKYELLPRHAHEGASPPRIPIFSTASVEKSQYTYIALLLYYIALLAYRLSHPHHRQTPRRHVTLPPLRRPGV